MSGSSGIGAANQPPSQLARNTGNSFGQEVASMAASSAAGLGGYAAGGLTGPAAPIASPFFACFAGAGARVGVDSWAASSRDQEYIQQNVAVSAVKGCITGVSAPFIAGSVGKSVRMGTQMAVGTGLNVVY